MKMEASTPAFRIVRGASGLWEVVEEGMREALALFRAPQAALSYACDVAAERKGSVVVILNRMPARKRGRLPFMAHGMESRK